MTTEHCPRCKGSGIDPEHSSPGCTDPDRGAEPPNLEPCLACQFPAPKKPVGEDRLRAGLLHLAAEAHRRKWAYSRAEDDRRPNPAFDELHRIGNELRTLLDTTPRDTTADDAWGSVWLYGNWRAITRQMTTPERELAADAVARWDQRLNEDDPDLGSLEGLRWWRG